MKPKVKLLSHFFETITVDFPKFPHSPGKTLIPKPKSNYNVYRSRTKLEVFAVKVFTTVMGKLIKGNKVNKFKVYVVSIAEFEVQDKKTNLISPKLDISLISEAIKLVQKTSLAKLQGVLRSPYLSKIPFPSSQKLKTN